MAPGKAAVALAAARKREKAANGVLVQLTRRFLELQQQVELERAEKEAAQTKAAGLQRELSRLHASEQAATACPLRQDWQRHNLAEIREQAARSDATHAQNQLDLDALERQAEEQSAREAVSDAFITQAMAVAVASAELHSRVAEAQSLALCKAATRTQNRVDQKARERLAVAESQLEEGEHVYQVAALAAVMASADADEARDADGSGDSDAAERDHQLALMAATRLTKIAAKEAQLKSMKKKDELKRASEAAATMARMHKYQDAHLMSSMEVSAAEEIARGRAEDKAREASDAMSTVQAMGALGEEVGEEEAEGEEGEESKEGSCDAEGGGGRLAWINSMKENDKLQRTSEAASRRALMVRHQGEHLMSTMESEAVADIYESRAVDSAREASRLTAAMLGEEVDEEEAEGEEEEEEPEEGSCDAESGGGAEEGAAQAQAQALTQALAQLGKKDEKYKKMVALGLAQVTRLSNERNRLRADCEQAQRQRDEAERQRDELKKQTASVGLGVNRAQTLTDQENQS